MRQRHTSTSVFFFTVPFLLHSLFFSLGLTNFLLSFSQEQISLSFWSLYMLLAMGQIWLEERTPADWCRSDWVERLSVDRIWQELGRGRLGKVPEEDLLTSSPVGFWRASSRHYLQIWPDGAMMAGECLSAD